MNWKQFYRELKNLAIYQLIAGFLIAPFILVALIIYFDIEVLFALGICLFSLVFKQRWLNPWKVLNIRVSPYPTGVA